jgi:hypothetical protein
MRGACKRAESDCRFAHPKECVTTHDDGSVTVCMDAVKGRCARDPCRYFHPPLHLQAQIKAAQSRAIAVNQKSSIIYHFLSFIIYSIYFYLFYLIIYYHMIRIAGSLKLFHINFSKVIILPLFYFSYSSNGDLHWWTVGYLVEFWRKWFGTWINLGMVFGPFKFSKFETNKK